MPRTFRAARPQMDRDPEAQLGINVKQTPIDLQMIAKMQIQGLVNAFKLFTGIDLADPGKLLDSLIDGAFGFAGKILGALTGALGFDLSDLPGKLGQLETALENVPVIGDVVKAITGKSGPLSDVTAFVGHILDGSLITKIGADVIDGLLHPTVVPPLQDLFGLLTGQQIKSGAVTQDKVATRDPSNLVWNGDFEDGWTGWQSQAFTAASAAQIVSNRAFQGAASLRLKSDTADASAGVAAWTSEGVACAGGDKFTITVRLYAEAEYWGGPEPQYFTAADGWRYFAPDSAAPAPPIPLGQWNTVVQQVTAPQGAERVRVSMWAYRKDEIWLDRIELRRAYASAQDVAQVGQSTADLSKAVVTLANATYAASAYAQPFSRTGGNPFEDNTYGRDLLAYQVFRGDVETSRVDDHTHTIQGGNGTPVSFAGGHSHVIARSGSAGMPLFTPALGRLYVLPVSCERDRPYSQAVLQTTGTALPSKFLLAVGQINRATGEITRVYDFGDVRGSIAPQPDTAQLVDQIFNTTANISSSAGSLNCLLMLQTGGSATPVAAIADRPRQNGSVPLYPKYLTGHSTATNLASIPATIANSSLATAPLGAWLWGALSQPYQSQLDQDSTYLDDFNRSNANTLGTMWTTSPNYFQINAGAAQLVSNAFNLGTRAVAIYTQPFRSDNQSVEATIKSFSTVGQFGLILRRNAQGTAWAQMVVKKDKATFEVATGSSATEYASAAITGVQTGARFRLSASGNVFNGYLNNTLLWTVTDTAGLLGNGTQTRNWGFFADYQTFNSAVPSPIDQIVATSTVT